MEKSNEQKLIDILFEIAIMTKENKILRKMEREKYSEWVRTQLREYGFGTFACGSSWAILKKE